MRRGFCCAGRRPMLLASALMAILPSIDGSVNLSPGATSDKATMLSGTLSPSYIGMGIEPSNLFAFVGTTSPNTLTNNLLSNLANYTGIPPHIRVGGNTEDLMIYDSSYTGYYLGVNSESDSAANANIFGPNYFDAINNLPAKTPVSLGIGMAYDGSDAIQMGVSIAAQAINTLTNVNLVGLEVGNEPDLYIENGFRNSSWSITDYGNEWIARVEAIYTQVLQPNNIGTAFFEAACTATTATFPDYKIENLVSTGLGTNNGAYLAGWNQHDYYYYVNVSSYQLTLSGLLSLSSTSGQFTEWASEAAAAKVTGKPYYVREMGSVGPAGLEGISNTFGNALWTLNFFLYASTVGVDSVQMHMLQDSYGSPWQPITDPNNAVTFVRPSYYAFAAMNQIIGAKCATTVAQIDLSNYPSNYGNRLGAYAIYDGSALQSLVLLNTQLTYQGDDDAGSQSFIISLPTLAGQTFYLSTLTAAGVDSTANVTWNGINYEQSGDGSPTKSKRSTIATAVVGSDGTLNVTVRDSQAVVANLGSVLGTENNVVDTKACEALAATTSEGGASSTTSGKGAAPTFKSTTGFKSSGLSMAAIIGIAAGGGAALLIILALLICCCVRRSKKKKMERQEALLPPRTLRYNNVPQRDSLDSGSADDMWMLPLGAKRDSQYSRNDSGSSTPLKNGHSRANSYANSVTDVPLTVNPNNMSEYAPRSSDRVNRYSAPVSAAIPAMPPLPAEYRNENNRRSYQHQPHRSSNLAGQVTNYNNRDAAHLEGYQRGRPTSHPSRPQGDVRQNRSDPRLSRDAPRSGGGGGGGGGGTTAQRRTPSAPPNSRSLPGSRNPSPNPPRDRSARSAQGHYSRQDYDSAPPVPSLSAPASRPPREPLPHMPVSVSHPTQLYGPRLQPGSRVPDNNYDTYNNTNNNEYSDYGRAVPDRRSHPDYHAM